jgi:hypothetical protein
MLAASFFAPVLAKSEAFFVDILKFDQIYNAPFTL